MENSPVRLWWRALRAYSFSATVIPVLCAFLFARAVGETVQWSIFPLTLLCALLFHAGVNLLNDYYDYTLGFDTDEASGSSGLLTEKLVPPAYMLRWGRFYLFAGATGGLALAALRGLPLLCFGLPAFAGVWFYSHPRGYKYKGLGEPFVFLLMGPILFYAATYAACRTIPEFSAWPAIAFGCLVAAILLVNNLRDLQMDGGAGFITLPMRLGPRNSRRLYALLVGAAFTVPAILFALGRFRLWILLPALGLPAAMRRIRTVLLAENLSKDLIRAPQKTAELYLFFGLLFAIGLFLGG